jgi:hypothetical protein
VTTTAPGTESHPSVIPFPLTARTLWLGGTVILSLLLYYFIGVDQGATSLFGHGHYVHEFVHDARHFVGFPCH